MRLFGPLQASVPSRGCIFKPGMRTDDQNFRVVCLGGSAGGLKAYLDILKAVPADTGMAFVVAPHRNFEHADLLPQILSGATDMPVAEVTQGMRLEPNRVYIMPPGKDMTVSRGVFGLQTSVKPRGWPQTISFFLLSLAQSYGSRAVAVILSGMDHDGVAALKAVKNAGGVTFAQSDPAVDAMPRHAEETGYVDYTLPSADIAKALLELPIQS
jgi:two-component system CheB/CheR fusion protein